ncbi:hypothetical protein TIFTF001_006636 [Ficus carica]|uniref:Uncharacterized protein n=1 Tax=Ficus carica TaxID=3494 RepID=A0AA88CW74_FICCA|nr:hypothetical protein TIFTF001_006636 [Ficus carica]
MKGIKVVVYFRTPISEVFRHRSCLLKLWCIGEGAPPSMESPEVERVTSFGMVGEVENKMCSRLNYYFRGFSGHGFLFFPGNGCFRRLENSFIDRLNLVKKGCLGNGRLGR